MWNPRGKPTICVGPTTHLVTPYPRPISDTPHGSRAAGAGAGTRLRAFQQAGAQLSTPGLLVGLEDQRPCKDGHLQAKTAAALIRRNCGDF